MAVTAICSVFMSSCSKLENADISVSAKSQLISSKKNMSTFVIVKCAGDWTLSLEYEGEESGWAELDRTSGTGDKNSIQLNLVANPSESRRSVKVILASGASTSECVVTQKGSGEMDEGDEQTPVVPDDSTEPVPSMDLTKFDWLELPAMDNDELGYYTHSFEMAGKRYRNYSFGWSQKDLVAIWVAYPLCRLYTNGNAGRTDAWAYDKLLKKNSSAPFGGYGEELARGHQIPSADRQCCYEANAQTFYGTNMTPQNNDHNSGIWADLESKVRGYAKTSDTTYVVTGVVLEGSNRKTYDSDGRPMTVPAAYFKAVLKYSTLSTMGQWNAAAFYLEHRPYSGNVTKSHSMSIDELEAITGLDFFVNLPAKIGKEKADKIEADKPADNPLWW